VLPYKRRKKSLETKREGLQDFTTKPSKEEEKQEEGDWGRDLAREKRDPFSRL
jgi:hypothetical protein